jgi:hypothetical protein
MRYDMNVTVDYVVAHCKKRPHPYAAQVKQALQTLMTKGSQAVRRD